MTMRKGYTREMEDKQNKLLKISILAVALFLGMFLSSIFFYRNELARVSASLEHEGKTAEQWSTMYSALSVENDLTQSNEEKLSDCIEKAEAPWTRLISTITTPSITSEQATANGIDPEVAAKFNTALKEAKSTKISNDSLGIIINKVEKDRQFCLDRYK